MSGIRTNPHGARFGKRTGQSKYPFAAMGIGDAQFVEAAGFAYATVRNRWRNAAISWAKTIEHDRGKKFSCRKCPGGFTITRIQ